MNKTVKQQQQQQPQPQPHEASQEEAYNEFTFRLVRKETRSRSGSCPKAFWGLDVSQIESSKDEILSKIPWKLIVSRFVQSVDRGLLAAQLNNGSDTYDMSEKLSYAKDYIKAGFGRPISEKQTEKAKLLGANKAMFKLLELMAKDNLTSDDTELALAIGQQFPELSEFVEKLVQD